MSQNTNYAEIARTLAKSLDLHQSPVAISLADSVPQGIETHQGRVPADAVSGRTPQPKPLRRPLRIMNFVRLASTPITCNLLLLSRLT